MLKQNYQAIARKYRPERFTDVVGQEAIVTTLMNALKGNCLGHAYLFCGMRGTGKTTLARLLAKALNCKEPTDHCEPCNQCPSCLEISAGHSLDILEVDGASNRGIDDIRQINETVCYSGSERYKVYIIDEVHMLTKEAFNALLKTLEEPPANVKFFFATTEPHKVPATIISRCQRFDLQRITLSSITTKLKKISSDLNLDVEEDALNFIASLAEGGLRDAESLLDRLSSYRDQKITQSLIQDILGITPLSTFFQLDQAIAEQNTIFPFELTEQLFSSGKDLHHFIDSLIEHFRHLLIFKLSLPEKHHEQLSREQMHAYQNSVKNYSKDQILHNIDYLMQWTQQLSKTPFKRFTLEMILLHLIKSRYQMSVASLVERLEQLKQDLYKPTTAQPTDLPTEAATTQPAALHAEEPKVVSTQPTDLPTEAATTQPADLPTEEPKATTTQSVDLNAEEPAKKLEEKLLSALRNEPESDKSSQRRYDTIMRFASVELEGSIQQPK